MSCHRCRAELAAIQAGTAQALVVNIAVDTNVTGRAQALILVEAVNALPVDARVGRALVDIVLTVDAKGALWAVALVPVGEVLAGTAVLAGLLVARVDLGCSTGFSSGVSS